MTGKINLDDMKKMYEQMTSGKKGNVSNDEFLKKFVQLEDGSNVLRILPPKSDQNRFYEKSAIHRLTVGGQKKNIHCPKVVGDKCPICDAYYALWKMHNNTGLDKSPYSELARSIKPAERYYMNVLVRPSNEVKIFSTGFTVFKMIVEGITGKIDEKSQVQIKEPLGDITDLKEGYDFIVIKSSKDKKNQYPDYSGSIYAPKPSRAGTDKEIARFLDELHDIHTLIKRDSYESLRPIADGLLASVGSTSSTIPTSARQETSNDEDDESFINNLRG